MHIIFRLFLVSLTVSCLFGEVEASNPNTNWLESFADFKIVEIPAIPASHNSGAGSFPRDIYNQVVSKWAQNQNSSIRDQLSWGIRFLDLRLHVTDSSITISHYFDTLNTLRSALSDVADFLAANPSEFVIVYARVDFDRPLSNHKRHLNPTEWERDAAPKKQRILETLNEFQSIIAPVHNANIADITVREVRGKMILLIEKESLILPANNGLSYVQQNINSGFDVCDIWRHDTFFNRSFRSSVDDSGMTKLKRCMERVVENPKGLFGIAVDITIKPFWQSYTSPMVNRWFFDQFAKAGKDKVYGAILFDFVNPDQIGFLIEYNREYIRAQ